jgi:hypothetical protein
VMVSASRSLYRSTNNGEIWTSVAIPTDLPYLTELVSSPGGEVFAVWSRLGYQGGAACFRSLNLGDSWTPIGSLPVFAFLLDIPSICFHPDGTIYCATSEHHVSGIIYRSTDDGDSWTQCFQL